MKHEAQFMLARAAGVSEAGFRAGLRHMAETAANVGSGVEWVTLVPPESLGALAHVAESGGGRAANAILTVSGEHAAAAAKAIGEAISTVADPKHSQVSGGTRHSILTGHAPIRLFFGLRRLEKLTRAEFQGYWLNVHADFGRRLIPPYSYHQIHAEEALTDELAQLCGLPPSPLDGIVEVHFPDRDALIRQLMRPEVASEALADERNFIDHARSAFHVYRDPGA